MVPESTHGAAYLSCQHIITTLSLTYQVLNIKSKFIISHTLDRLRGSRHVKLRHIIVDIGPQL